jgi:hypothetical protein
MTLDVLKSEVVKLQRAELFDFVEFILLFLKEKEIKKEKEFGTPNWLKLDISERAEHMKSGEAQTLGAHDIYQEIIDKHGFNIPTTLLS